MHLKMIHKRRAYDKYVGFPDTQHNLLNLETLETSSSFKAGLDQTAKHCAALIGFRFHVK